MRYRWLSGLTLALIPMLACASSAGPTPKVTIEEYCRLDFDGARLSAKSAGYRAIYALVAWETEPGWDKNLVVVGYTVRAAKQGRARAHVEVEYNVRARLMGVSPIEVVESQERVEFTLVRRGDVWLIEEPQIPPHVSPAAMIEHLESLIQTTKDEKYEERRAALGRLIDQLRAIE